MVVSFSSEEDDDNDNEESNDGTEGGTPRLADYAPAPQPVVAPVPEGVPPAQPKWVEANEEGLETWDV